MATCNKKITDDMLFDCSASGKAGVDSGFAVIINSEDLDLTGTSVSASTISDLILNSGTTGYKLEFYKQLINANGSYSPNAEAVDGFIHTVNLRMSTPSAESANRATEIKNGRFIVIIETTYKGVNNGDAFRVLGFENGLELSEMQTSTNENASNITFSLTTREGNYEQYIHHIFNETNYATSKAAFDSLFANP